MGKYHLTYLINKTETHDLRDENEVVNEIDIRNQLEELKNPMTLSFSTTPT